MSSDGVDAQCGFFPVDELFSPDWEGKEGGKAEIRVIDVVADTQRFVLQPWQERC